MVPDGMNDVYGMSMGGGSGGRSASTLGSPHTPACSFGREGLKKSLVIKIIRRSQIESVDGLWVRRWRSRQERLIKSRLCGRGYLDKQKAPYLHQ